MKCDFFFSFSVFVAVVIASLLPCCCFDVVLLFVVLVLLFSPVSSWCLLGVFLVSYCCLLGCRFFFL
ncbi:uncharacterized protein GGS25DRAFT_474563, partial [Hypoxylon fragiforme]|uniref:uncharacterized protein n=1 Tax=Hypoxylon fragiforme TaxID=63214 RepID=UPI0020C6FC8F